MKSVRIITMIAMTMVTVFFGVYANIQKRYAEDAIMHVNEQEQLATANMQHAEKQKEIAIKRTAEAALAQNMVKTLEEELTNCPNNR